MTNNAAQKRLYLCLQVGAHISYMIALGVIEINSLSFPVYVAVAVSAAVMSVMLDSLDVRAEHYSTYSHMIPRITGTFVFLGMSSFFMC